MTRTEFLKLVLSQKSGAEGCSTYIHSFLRKVPSKSIVTTDFSGGQFRERQRRNPRKKGMANFQMPLSTGLVISQKAVSREVGAGGQEPP